MCLIKTALESRTKKSKKDVFEILAVSVVHFKHERKPPGKA